MSGTEDLLNKSTDERLREIFKIYEDLFSIQAGSRLQLMEAARKAGRQQSSGNQRKRSLAPPAQPG